ncbi:MAG: hypothetical protein ACRECO_03320 [Xanthobacteraceae bacterium]
MSITRLRNPISGLARARRGFLAGLAAALAAVVVAYSSPGAAQQVQQIALTAKHVEGFIAANDAMMAAIEKIESSGKDPTQQQMDELDAIARKYGFKDFGEYEDVSDNISLVLSGIDPKTKQFTQPPEVIKKEIAQLKADKSLSAAERKQILQELNEQFKMAQPIAHPGNIKLVTKYYEKLEAIFQ